MRRAVLPLLAVSLLACRAAPPALPATADPPVDRAHPPRMEPVLVPSGGVAMNGVLYLAQGAGPHPSVVLLHGFPGNEQNLDLAQAIRRAGFHVLTLHYRGSWGSPGSFSFAGAIEDARAALAYLRDPAVVAKHRIDPRRQLVIGHSMGGFLAATAAAGDPQVAAVGMLAAWDLGDEGRRWAAMTRAGKRATAVAEVQPDTVPLAGCTPDGLIDEAIAHAEAWDLTRRAARLAPRPLLVVSTDDGLAAGNRAQAAALAAAGGALTHVHLAGDHAFSGRRIELATRVVDWLRGLR